MNIWIIGKKVKISKTLLPEKQDFYSHLYMDYITDVDYVHAKKVCKNFEIKNLGQYHDLYIQSNYII